MKLNKFFTATLALSGLALAGTSAKASVTASDTDLILGFFSLNSSTGAAAQADVLTIDLGAASQFYNATPGSTFTLTGVTLADLQGIYGSNWFSNTSNLLYWGIVGTAGSATADGHAKAGTVWSTIASSAGSRAATSKSVLQIQVGHIQNLYSSLNGATATSNSATATDDLTSDTNGYYQQDNIASSASFGNINPLVDNNNSTAVSGVEYSDLWELQQGTGLTGKGTATRLGTFALNSSGVLTFTAAPEPSTVTLAIGAGLAMLASRRRRLA
ncbi:MAG: hypothetical protein QM796_09070 [Chthoniobacteraceae bacterium]